MLSSKGIDIILKSHLHIRVRRRSVDHHELMEGDEDEASGPSEIAMSIAYPSSNTSI
jgi:hypothetical protein